MGLLKLFVDRQNRRLVTSDTNSDPYTLAPLFQYNTQTFELTVVDPISQFSSPQFSKVDISSFGIRLAIGATPAGTAGQTPLAIITAWSAPDANQKVTGVLALNTTDIDTYIGAAAQKDAYIEITLTIAGTRTTIYQGTVTLKAAVDEGSATAPVPTAQYYNTGEADSTFAKKSQAAGDFQIWTSPDGLKKARVYLNNDGALQADPIA